MTKEEVYSAFDDFSISFWRDNYVVSWYDKRDDNVANAKTPSVYSFTITESTPMTIRAMIYSDRLYPSGCKGDQTLIKLTLRDSTGKRLN